MWFPPSTKAVEQPKSRREQKLELKQNARITARQLRQRAKDLRIFLGRDSMLPGELDTAADLLEQAGDAIVVPGIGAALAEETKG